MEKVPAFRVARASSVPRETGRVHDWFLPSSRGHQPLLGLDGEEIECCRTCGVVKARDPDRAAAATCRGPVKISLRRIT